MDVPGTTKNILEGGAIEVWEEVSWRRTSLELCSLFESWRLTSPDSSTGGKTPVSLSFATNCFRLASKTGSPSPTLGVYGKNGCSASCPTQIFGSAAHFAQCAKSGHVKQRCWTVPRLAPQFPQRTMSSEANTVANAPSVLSDECSIGKKRWRESCDRRARTEDMQDWQRTKAGHSRHRWWVVELIWRSHPPHIVAFSSSWSRGEADGMGLGQEVGANRCVRSWAKRTSGLLTQGVHSPYSLQSRQRWSAGLPHALHAASERRMYL